ncbi:MAG TPA: SET domain-containing protein-lysine N-methyltransferase [Candidatus Paceibacterota bacterium]
MKQFYVLKSKIHGYGLAAGENIKKGEVIARIRGIMKFKVNRNKKDALGNPDWVGVEKNIWIDPEKPYKFINHSCDANAGIKGKRTLGAVKNIREGEEITLDYSTIEGDNRWAMICACNSNGCRKLIKSIHHLSEEDFNKYMPYIPSYFKKIYISTAKKNGKKV